MALKNYRLLVGRPSASALDDDDSPHIEIRVEAANQSHRIAVNVRSQIFPHALLYKRIDGFNLPITDDLAQLSDGVIDIRGDNQALALDYVRGGLFDRNTMQIAPFQREGMDNDLKEFLMPLIAEAIADPSARVFAFGEAWGPEEHLADKYFGFLPGRGIHDIHMNQGSQGRFRNTNGPNQDGALLVHFADSNRWVAIFLAFQSQDWHTDAQTGHPVSDEGEPRPPIEREPILDGAIQFIAAMVNAPNPEEGRETVTLLNRSDGAADLTGWHLVDKNNRQEPLDGRAIGAGEALRIVLSGQSARLGNSGGSLKLVDAGGTVVHMISYEKSDVAPEGWTVIF